MGLVTIWFAGGTIFAWLASLLHLSVWVQISVFLLTSAVLLFFTRPLVKRKFNKNITKTNVESMVGKVGVVIEEIDPLNFSGQVKIDGNVWSAKTSNSEKIEKDERVEVLEVSGVKVVVKKIVKEEN